MPSRDHKYDHPEGFAPESSGYPWSIDRQLLAHIPQNSRILELGCATGYMGRYLKEKRNARMTGIEGDAASAQAAHPSYEDIRVGDLDAEDTYRGIAGRFDVILCAAVLEHLRDPAEALRRMTPLLSPQGFFLISLPNIAHWSIRWSLLRGRFTYQDYGILDRTHLRFYTYRSIDSLITDSDLMLEQKGFDPDAGIPILQGIVRRLPGGWALLRWLYGLCPNLFAYQTWVKAVRR